MRLVCGGVSQRVLSRSLGGFASVRRAWPHNAALVPPYRVSVVHYTTTTGTSSSSSSPPTSAVRTGCQAQAEPTPKTRSRSGKRVGKRDADYKLKQRDTATTTAAEATPEERAAVLYDADAAAVAPRATESGTRAWRRAGRPTATRRAPQLYAGENTTAEALQQYVHTLPPTDDHLTRQQAQSDDDDAAGRTRHSDAEVQSRGTLRALLNKLLSFAAQFAERVTHPATPPSDRTLRQLELQLELAITTDSCEAYSALAETMRGRYADASFGGRRSADFLRLYARVLVNYGAFCLVNFAGQHAATLLQRAMLLMHESATTDDATPAQSTTCAPTPHDLPIDTTLLYVRVLLANAWATEQQYWQAAEQLQLALHTLQRYPHLALPQLCPGLVGWQRVNEAFVMEEEAQFMRDTARVTQAVAQGKAQLLLLQSQGPHDTHRRRAMEVQLSVARLLRQSHDYATSQAWYERYLDALVAHDAEDAQGAMLELGRMLCFDMAESETGLVYLESAAQLLREDAEEGLRANPTQPSSTVTCTVVQAAGVVLDTALVLHALERPGRALTLMTTCVTLLERAGLESIAAWAMVQHANMLSGVSFVDRALELYVRAMRVLRASETRCATTTHLDPPRQLSAMQRMIPYSSLEAESRLAHCLHLHVGDHRRALVHYRRVLAAVSLLSPDDAPYTALNPHPAEPLSPSGATARGGLAPDVVHWVLEQYVACCERLQSWPAAIAAQSRLIELEAAVGANHIAAYLKLIDLTRRNGDLERQLALYFFLFFLPDDVLDAETRVHVAHGFAKCCYMLDNHRMGAVLLNAVQRVRGEHDPGALVDYALCLKSLSAQDRLHLDAVAPGMETGVAAIGRVFRRAASLMVAHHVIDTAEASAAHGVARVDRALSGLITLSRGAFFFHQNNLAAEAEELYQTALTLAQEANITDHDDYTHELAILLTNYATLKVTTDAALARSLYERAAALCPDKLDVAEVVADYYVQAGNYEKGAAYMRRVIAAKPAAARQMHVQLARLGTSAAVWAGLSPAARLEVLEHLLCGLGVAAARLPCYAAASPTTEDNFDARVDALGELFVDGVATTPHGEVACLTNYVLQTRLHKPRLLNRLYEHAVRRFPFDTAVLVNYATFCADHGFTRLARKYYAKAYGLTNGDFSRTQCYANCLSSYFDEQQVVCGEVLYRDYLERHDGSALAHAHYANYLAVTMPTPFAVERHFEQALRLDPKSSQTHQLYAHFVWACADSRAAYEQSEVQVRVFDRAEQLMRAAVALDPHNVATLLHLGTLYANRRNRFADAMSTLYTAHQLSPRNVEVVRQMCAVLLVECASVQEREQRKVRGAAKQGADATVTSPQLRELVSSTQRSLDCALQLDPNHRTTLEQYANFAVRFLRDPVFAAELFRRIQRLDRRD